MKETHNGNIVLLSYHHAVVLRNKATADLWYWGA